jgi:glucosamine--fructose-6-phosphate aminotransferase (isomerizing)
LSGAGRACRGTAAESKVVLAIKNLLVAVSRSGTTTETVKAIEKFKAEKRGDVVVISNYDETLSRLADTNIVISKGQEESVAQTRSFASMYVAASAFCARMAGREDLVDAMRKLPEAGNLLIGKYESLAKEMVNLSLIAFISWVPAFAMGWHAEAKREGDDSNARWTFHTLEFRHGPMSMVNQKAVVVGLLSDVNRVHEVKVLSEMKTLGGTVIGLGEKEADVQFESGIPEQARGVLYLPILQLLAFYRSVAKGFVDR